MTRKTMAKRLDRAAARIDAAPLKASAVDDAFAKFVATGQLPESRRLAEAAANRALMEPEPTTPRIPARDEYVARLAMLQEMALALEKDEGDGFDEADVDVRPHLVRLVLHGDPIEEHLARGLFVVLAQLGVDLTKPVYRTTELDLPADTELAAEVLDWPLSLVREPDRAMARRLMQKLLRLFEQLGEWPDCVDEFTAALWRTEKEGVMPNDEVLRAAVMANMRLRELLAG